MRDPLVGIVIVNWNGEEDTLECLKSLDGLTYANRRTLVVDNASTDGSVAAIREAFPDIDILEIPTNEGYADACNHGIKRVLSDGVDAVFLLNNDLVFDPDCLSILVETLYSLPDVRIANPVTYYYDDPKVIWAAGGVVDQNTGITYQLGIGERDEGQYGGVRDVDFGVGAALLVRREMVESTGPMDTRFFLYYEETEWCLRARDAGFRAVMVPQAKIWHKVSRSTSKISTLMDYYFTRNRLLFLRMRGRGTLGLLSISTRHFARTAAAMLFRGERRRSLAVLSGVVDFWRGRTGRHR